MGRPRVKIEWGLFDKLCGLQCTLAEIAGVFECSEDTIERAVMREKKESFADYYKKKSQAGKMALRRAQFRLAEKSASMAIWLGKQHLGQRDEVFTNLTAEIEDLAPLARLLNNDNADY